MPKEFVRCGYPLTIKMILEQQSEDIENDCERVFAALGRRSISFETVPSEEEKRPDLGFPMFSMKDSLNMSPTVHGMLCAAIAAYRLENQNYGGNVRSIVERDGPFEAGSEWLVTKKSLVKTGNTRQRSTGGSWLQTIRTLETDGVNQRRRCGQAGSR